MTETTQARNYLVIKQTLEPSKMWVEHRWNLPVRKMMAKWDLQRQWRWFWQRRKRGFDDRECWNLDFTIAEFLVPRLRRFKEMSYGHPATLTENEWDDRLEDMIWAFEQHREELLLTEQTEEMRKKHARGLTLFSYWFSSLWN